MKVTKNQFLKWFAITVCFLAVVRLIFPSIADDKEKKRPLQEQKDIQISKDEKNEEPSTAMKDVDITKDEAKTATQTVIDSSSNTTSSVPMMRQTVFTRTSTRYTDSNGVPVKHPIIGVHSYKECFPDSNDVQLSAATSLGVSPIADRHEAEMKKAELVYVGANPYFVVQKLNNSIPYLVPRASLLLQDIGRNFFDSLQVKQIPLHKIIVTSVLRTTEDVSKLKGKNRNATENSCHLYGTTFDISYNRYVTVTGNDGKERREVSNDTLKWVLSEVLRDLRQENRCYIKHEVKQGCFHITVR